MALPPDDGDDEELLESQEEEDVPVIAPKRELKVEQLEFPLPPRLPRFNALDFMKFYNGMQRAELSLSDMEEYIVAYLNMYFICISTSRTEVAGMGFTLHLGKKTYSLCLQK